MAKWWWRRSLATASEQSVCHSSYANDLGRKSTLIKVKDPLNKRLLLNRAELSIDRRCLKSWSDTFKAAAESRFWHVKC